MVPSAEIEEKWVVVATRRKTGFPAVDVERAREQAHAIAEDQMISEQWLKRGMRI